MISVSESLSVERVEEFYKNVDSIFGGLVQILEASCGILVLSESKDSFIEVASYGYETDFYYPFLARGNGQFELIRNSKDPVLFSSKSFPLYRKESHVGFGVGIFLNCLSWNCFRCHWII